MGASLCGLIIQHVLDSQLHIRIEGEEANHVAERIRQSIEYIEEFPTDIQIVVRECYGAAVQAGFASCSCALAAAAFGVFWWREKKLDR